MDEVKRKSNCNHDVALENVYDKVSTLNEKLLKVKRRPNFKTKAVMEIVVKQNWSETAENELWKTSWVTSICTQKSDENYYFAKWGHLLRINLETARYHRFSHFWYLFFLRLENSIQKVALLRKLRLITLSNLISMLTNPLTQLGIPITLGNLARNEVQDGLVAVALSFGAEKWLLKTSSLIIFAVCSRIQEKIEALNDFAAREVFEFSTKENFISGGGGEDFESLYRMSC